jgi:hypothetical protein
MTENLKAPFTVAQKVAVEMITNNEYAPYAAQVLAEYLENEPEILNGWIDVINATNAVNGLNPVN